ncbi:unnamed protein product, partial [Didymodactylos carnosus]
YSKLNANSLNSVDENYINHKYVKYCLQSWNDGQLPSILNEIKEKKDMEKLIDNISKVKTIQDVLKLYPEPKCFKKLTENKGLLLKTDCDFILIQFKENIINCLKENIDDTELLLNVCVTHNKNSTNVQHVCYIDKIDLLREAHREF